MKVVGCVALACCALTVAQAQEKANVAGTWTWITEGRNGGPDRTNTLTLKVEGGAVTGSIGMGRNKAEISDAKVTGNEISFKTSRERNGTTTTATYTGKIMGDSLEGSIKTQRGDAEPRTATWKAKRKAPTS